MLLVPYLQVERTLCLVSAVVLMVAAAVIADQSLHAIIIQYYQQ